MRRETVIARLLRAFSGKTQEQLAADVGLHPSLIAHFELGNALPNREHLERLARASGLTLVDAEAIFNLYETLKRPRHRQGANPGDLFAALEEEVGEIAATVYQSLLRRPLPEETPCEADHRRAAELFRELSQLSQEERLAVVQSVGECQTLGFLQRVCAAAEDDSPESAEAAEAWARVAEEIAARLPS